MPMHDSLLQLASALAIPTASTNYTVAAPYLSSTFWNAVAVQDWGMGNGFEDIALYVRISTTVTGAASSTLQFGLFGGSTSAKVTTGGTPDACALLAPLAAIAQANFATQAAAGTEFKFKIPRGYPYQYWNVGVINPTGASNALTGGAFDAWIVTDSNFQDNKSYAAGYAV